MDMSWDMTEKDTDSDGTLSFEEFSAPQMEMLRAGFDMIDTNKDGKISADEWNTFLKVHGVSPKS
jgi:Ca2+-binding EF-hand superfamily protein